MKNILFICILLIGCNSSKSKKEKNASPVNDSTKSDDKVVENNRINKQSLLYGRWCGVGDTIPSFFIDTNKIFYFDASAYYRYSISHSTMKIFFDDYTDESEIKFKGKDTLILLGKGRSKGLDDTLYRDKKE